MRIGVQITPQATSVPKMRAAWRAADALGVDSIWLWDHFFPLYGDLEESHFEAYTLLAAMATDTCHAQIGVLVTCYSYRNPNLLADMARTIDHLSDGRFVLGMGSGWCERDYTEYGYEFGTVAGRLKALKAGLPIIKERLGRLKPGPVNGSLPLMIGGSGEKVTLRLVAEHADMSNVFGPPANVKHTNLVIDQWCSKIGRDPEEIERTVLVNAEDIKNADAFADAGTDHLIVSIESPFDLSEIGKIMASRK